MLGGPAEAARQEPRLPEMRARGASSLPRIPSACGCEWRPGYGLKRCVGAHAPITQPVSFELVQHRLKEQLLAMPNQQAGAKFAQDGVIKTGIAEFSI